MRLEKQINEILKKFYLKKVRYRIDNFSYNFYCFSISPVCKVYWEKEMEFTYKKGMGIGGWLTNYKRFNVLPNDKRLELTIGDYEHFESYITEWDVQNIKNMGLDHIRLGFDQIVLETEPYVYNEKTFKLVEDFVELCQKHNLALC